MAQAGVAYRDEKRMQELRLRRERAFRMNRLMLKAVVCAVMACLFVYISRMAAISAGAKEISQIRQEITQLREEQQYLEVFLAARQDLDRVRDEAIGRLGMGYPADGQIQLVSLSGYISGVNTQTAHDSTAP